jgi:hypothetical protein
MIQFIKTPLKENEHDISTVTMELPDSCTLPEILEGFENFLKAIGYHFEGNLDFVEEDEI